jgi:Zn-finger nucleic acid-binding protein
MRKLLCCPSCNRQFDATRLAVGSRFRCRCGAAIDVPVIDSRDAAVVRCASCGAAREEGSQACGYCGSDFTIHEQDLETICPSCFARISNSARFCHHCSTAIAPEELAADPTDRVCPACGDGKFLNSRALGDTRLTVLECGVCAGLWLGAEVFRTLEERARKIAPSVPDPVALRTEAKARQRTPQSPGPAYRPCPACRKRMNRVNFERASGILLDRCRDHGIWFDATELDAALRWVNLGGERVSDERRQQEERARASQLKFKVVPKTPEDARTATFANTDREFGFDAIPAIVNWLLKL